MVWSRTPTLSVYFVCHYRNISVTAIKMSIITKQMAPNTSVATNSSQSGPSSTHQFAIHTCCRIVIAQY